MLTPENFPCIRNYGDTPAINTTLRLEASDTLCQLFGRFPTIDEMEECMINTAMKLAGQRISQAAAMLGITRQALHRRLKNPLAE
jgi:transcriptional regulator of acetoin/glycerol metabolism